MGTLSTQQIRWLFVLTLVVGALARMVAWHWGPPIYADAYFQYLEPAWIRISGAGIQTWEWLEGIRSWVLPGYHGAWMALLSFWGLRGNQIGSILQLHWALLSLSMVWAAWRSGASMARQALRQAAPCNELPAPIAPSIVAPGWQAGFVAAWLVATFPLLALYSVETLSELPAMIGVVVGLALTVEIIEASPQDAKTQAAKTKVALVGVLVSLAVCLRLATAVIAVIPVIGLLMRRRWRDCRFLVLGAVIPLALFGLVDRFTWGGYFSSFIGYLKFNVIDGRAAQYFGRAPWHWYLTKFQSRLPYGLGPLIFFGLIRARVTWPWLGSAALLLSLVSAQPHKEERFAIVLWPLLLVAAGAGAGIWLMRKNAHCANHVERSSGPSETRPSETRPSGTRQRVTLRSILVLLGCLFVAGDGYWHLKRSDFMMTRDRYRAQVWVRNQPKATGLLVDWCFYTAGYFWFDSSLPMVQYNESLLGNRMFSHLLAPKGTWAVYKARRSGFVQVFQQGNIVVLARPSTRSE